MKLFQVRDTSNGALLPEYYPSKAAAKQARNLLEGARDDAAPRRYVVTPGPDHRHNEGE